MTNELPQLEIPCPDCTPDDVQAAMDADRKAWIDEEQAAYSKFVESYDGFSAYEEWKKTPAYRDLQDREPQPAGTGCVECDWTKVQLTVAGRELLGFVQRHTGGAR